MAQRDPNAPVAVIIVNWNGAGDTLTVLEELAVAEGPTLKPIVVDNGSTDDSVSVLRRSASEIELLETGRNLGFAGGNEVGIRHAIRDERIGWFLLLNNDVALDRRFLPPLIDACLDPSVAAAAPRILYFEKPNLVWAAGGRLRLRETVTEEIGKGQPDGDAWDVPRDVSYLTTCCLLVPRDALEAIGLFDPMYFIGVEDADWSRRALDAGYRLRYVPSSRIWHKVAVATGGSYTPFKTFHTGRSNTLFVKRHYGGLGLTWFLVVSAMALAVAFLREVMRGNAGAVVAKGRGILDALRTRVPDSPRL